MCALGHGSLILEFNPTMLYCYSSHDLVRYLVLGWKQIIVQHKGS
jgi:hypothetical protein